MKISIDGKKKIVNLIFHRRKIDQIERPFEFKKSLLGSRRIKLSQSNSLEEQNAVFEFSKPEVNNS